MNNIKNYFLKGLLYTVPIAVTIWVIIESYNFLDGIIGRHLPEKLQIPFLGIIVMFGIITLFGFAGTKLIATPIASIPKNLLNKAPLLKTIYSSVKDLMNTFVGQKKGFSEPVLVKVYENSTIKRIGFITNEDMESLNIIKGQVMVYMPHSYAISGQLFIVEKKNVTPIDQPASEVMKLIISGGVTEINEN